MEKKKCLCDYCLGCNLLKYKYFQGYMNCKNFIPGYADWNERYLKDLKGDKRNGM